MKDFQKYSTKKKQIMHEGSSGGLFSQKVLQMQRYKSQDKISDEWSLESSSINYDSM